MCVRVEGKKQVLNCSSVTLCFQTAPSVVIAGFVVRWRLITPGPFALKHIEAPCFSICQSCKHQLKSVTLGVVAISSHGVANRFNRSWRCDPPKIVTLCRNATLGMRPSRMPDPKAGPCSPDSKSSANWPTRQCSALKTVPQMPEWSMSLM